MVGVVRLLDRLSRNPEYREQVYAKVPDVARFDPGHDAVMMCYDFHLDGEMPRLIEVNTNAGGGMLAYLAQAPPLPVDHQSLPAKLRERLLRTFSDEIKKHSAGVKLKPERIAIIDENPVEQYLYPEMAAFADLFRAWGVPTEIVEPQRLKASAEGVSLDGQPVDQIYNRHCDFYLESAEMAGLRQAYLARKVCLTPNPHMYGLLADKRRMILWSDPQQRASWHLSGNDERLLEQTVPETSLLAELDLQRLWSERKQFVFKPVDSFGSRGVLVGEKLSRKRFDQLPAERHPGTGAGSAEHDRDRRARPYENRSARVCLSQPGARCDRPPVPRAGHEHAYAGGRFCPGQAGLKCRAVPLFHPPLLFRAFTSKPYIYFHLIQIENLHNKRPQSSFGP